MTILIWGKIKCNNCGKKEQIPTCYNSKIELNGWTEIDEKHYCEKCFAILSVQKFLEAFFVEPIELTEDDIEEIIE